MVIIKVLFDSELWITIQDTRPEMDGVETKFLGLSIEDLGLAAKELEGMGESDVLETPQFGEPGSDTHVSELMSIEQSIVIARYVYNHQVWHSLNFFPTFGAAVHTTLSSSNPCCSHGQVSFCGEGNSQR